MALELPELSPRELATRFTDTEGYFVSEASVYRLLKSHDLITPPIDRRADSNQQRTYNQQPNNRSLHPFSLHDVMMTALVFLLAGLALGHFLLSKAAKTLSLAQVFRMSDAEAEGVFRRIRWADTNGTPVCPSCGSVEAYEARRANGALRFRCKGCKKDFTITSGTLFASLEVWRPDFGCVTNLVGHAEHHRNAVMAYSSRRLMADILSYQTNVDRPIFSDFDGYLRTYGEPRSLNSILCE
jgi:transposase-like protein